MNERAEAERTATVRVGQQHGTLEGGRRRAGALCTKRLLLLGTQTPDRDRRLLRPLHQRG